MKGRRPDLSALEREILRAAERARVDAQEIADRLRGDAQAAAEQLRQEAIAAGERVKDEAPRKAIHLTMIVIPLAILYLPLPLVRWVLMFFGILLIVVDLFKIHDARWRAYFKRFFGKLIRGHEEAGITGSTYMIVSALLATYLFTPPVAAAALVFLIVGDTLAAMVGKAFGRVPLFGKSLEGFLAGFVSSFVAAWLLVPSLPWTAVLAAALAGSIVEIAPIPVDDNFRIPLVAGLVLQWLV
ncbi:MAG: hypothetical protein R3B81_10940 [bacterium]